MSNLARWLPEPPELGRFRFAPGGPPRGDLSALSLDELRQLKQLKALRRWRAGDLLRHELRILGVSVRCHPFPTTLRELTAHEAETLGVLP